MHGGSAPQVKQAAKERLAALVDPAITTLSKLLKDKYSNVRLGAVRDVLDRAGFKAVDHIEIEGSLDIIGTLAAGRERIAGLRDEPIAAPDSNSESVES